MDEVERFLADIRPDEDAAAVDGAWAVFDRLRRRTLRPGRSRRAWAAGLTTAGLLGAVVAGGSVAAAANGTAPAPVSQAMTAAGVLRPAPSPTPDSAAQVVQGLRAGALAGYGVLVQVGASRPGQPVPFVVFGVPDSVLRMRLDGPDGSTVEVMTAAPGAPGIFLGTVVDLDHAGDDELVGVDADGTQVVRVTLDEAWMAYGRLLKSSVDAAQATP